ncbi:MAG: GNAT family N-acetyltransferase [Candidatus Viridilinea halotolerans]|uniref:GNAT family N-acetyltransferase n=1 Tax=Candidatus Viridilinea halotolerans TaxID=2491704 RepID=A0A426U787_9CHLR|nr:MAG: GNAT family N-acetyltransferase [Candidatus Viridilinea halotolerans]
MHIYTLTPTDTHLRHAAATLLVAEFREHWPEAWPALAAALVEVAECLAPSYICRVALDEAGALLGWIGARPTYNGRVWELHPLVVRSDQQGQGIGRALVADLEAQVAAQGGLTIMLGTDDEDDMTSLGGCDLYPDPLAHLAAIRNVRRHPYGFYQRCGFSLVGVIPDANGLGKPDIMMAKRVVRPEALSKPSML